MKTILWSSVLLAVGLTAWAKPKSMESSVFEAGAAEIEITPPVGYTHYRGVSTGIRAPLHAKALALRQGEESAALVFCDLLSITRELSATVRTLASEATGIPYSSIFLAATHTHTGPRYGEDLDGYVRRLREDRLTAEDREGYAAHLVERVTEAVTKAHRRLRPVKAQSGVIAVEGISFNRRFLMKDGRVRFNPGVENPDIVQTVGPIDPAMGVLLFRDVESNAPLFSLLNFALHLDTAGGTEYGPDYPGVISEVLKERFGASFVSLFGTGTCGDINHIDVSPRPSPTTRVIGEVLAERFLEALPGLEPVGRPSLAARPRTVFARLQNYTFEELEWAKADSDVALYPERPFLQQVRRRKILTLHEMRDSGEAIAPTVGSLDWTFPLEVQAVRIGAEAAIVSMPGEVFVKLGLMIKEDSPFANTMVVELTNTNINYVPDREAFAQGDYEVINSRIQPGEGEKMAEAISKLLHELWER